MGRYDEIDPEPYERDPDAAYEAWREAQAEAREVEEFYGLREPPFDPEEEALEEHRERRLEEHARFSETYGEDLEEERR